jgi:Uma2 family endonuclease
MTLDEFVAWEDRQELRYEYDGIHARAMTGGTQSHAAIQVNLLAALKIALKGKPCRPFGSQLKVRTATSIRYPDALVTCVPGDPRSTFAPDPTVLFEILSPSSARFDLGGKNAEYQTIPSLRRYVALHQAQAAAEVFRRDENGDWTYEFVAAPGALEMPEIDIALTLAEIYEGVF